ncbi:MAG: M48 family metallopeptidase [Bacillota bacterium]
MRLLDLTVLLLILVPPLLHRWHGMRLLARGASPTRVATAGALYYLVPPITLFWMLGTDLPGRLAEVTGVESLSLAAIWLPLLGGQWLHTYVAYQLDQRARQAAWSFGEYARSTQLVNILLAAFMGPMALGAPILELLFPEPEEWFAWTAMAALLGLSLLFSWRVWRWCRIRFEPVEPALAERLTALCQRLGLSPTAIQVMPMRHGKVANAFLAGFRESRCRILLTDYLLSACTPEQVEVVVAHEVAHARLGHLRTRLWLSAGLFVLLLGLASGWFWLARALHLSRLLFVLPLCFLGFLPPLLAMPVLRRQEFEADRWAAEATGRGAELAATLEHLERLNQVDTAQLPRWIRLMVGHPVTRQRADALRALAGTGD